LYFEHRPELRNAAVGQNGLSKLPILTLKVVFVSGVQFFTNLHNKTCHFFTFFSIFPLFVSFFRFFRLFLRFFPAFNSPLLRRKIVPIAQVLTTIIAKK